MAEGPNKNAGAPAASQGSCGKKAQCGWVFRERWGSNRVSLEMIGPTENGKVSVRLWLF